MNSRKSQKWFVPSSAAKKAEDLSFVGEVRGRGWWNVIPPQTSYTQAHYATGKAFAWELLDYLNGAGAERDPEILAHIALSITGDRIDSCRGQMLFGFFETLSKFIAGKEIAR